MKLPRIPRRTSKSANDIGDSSKDTSITRRSRTYKPSNRYSNIQINILSGSSANNTDDAHEADMNVLCASCARNLLAAAQSESESNEEKTDDIPDNGKDEQHAFLKAIASCRDTRKNCIRNEIAEVNAKILHLTGPSPRSCYVRQNVTGLITYRHYREKECKIETISNETKHIALAKPDKSTAFGEDKKKSRNAEHAELVFDVVTRDMQRMQLRSTQLKDSRCILSCLENYLAIGRN